MIFWQNSSSKSIEKANFLWSKPFWHLSSKWYEKYSGVALATGIDRCPNMSISVCSFDSYSFENQSFWINEIIVFAHFFCLNVHKLSELFHTKFSVYFLFALFFILWFFCFLDCKHSLKLHVVVWEVMHQFFCNCFWFLFYVYRYFSKFDFIDFFVQYVLILF